MNCIDVLLNNFTSEIHKNLAFDNFINNYELPLTKEELMYIFIEKIKLLKLKTDYYNWIRIKFILYKTLTTNKDLFLAILYAFKNDESFYNKVVNLVDIGSYTS